MDEIIYYSELYDFYKNMLTEKQKDTFKDYFFENLSLDEIASNYNISKNAVSKTIKVIKSSLDNLEEKLHLKKYYDSIKEEFQEDKSIQNRLEKYDSILFEEDFH